MDERGYVAQALLDRLRDEGLAYRVLNDEVELAVPRAALEGMPRQVARFCHEYDLALVHLARTEPERWCFVLAWSDEVGRPSYLRVEVIGDYYRGARRLLASHELLAGASDALFLFGLAEALEQQDLDPARGEWLTELWHANPRSAIERLGQHLRTRGQVRLIANAAKQGKWEAARAQLPALRRALRKGMLPTTGSLARTLFVRLENLTWPRAATVAFVGPHEPALREQILQELAPAGVRSATSPNAADIAIVAEPAEEPRGRFEEVVRVESGLGAPESAAKVQRAVLRWLEWRVERRYPEAVVGKNPPAARALQFACRHRVPVLRGVLRAVLNSDIDCRLRSPILMPHPYGIVIHGDAVIGSRVTVMHQATLGIRRPGERGAPHVEDNVVIGPGAKVLGPVRIGRGAVIGANAVVTRDVPSHCTVVGANRILRGEEVVPERHLAQNVVNM